MDIIFTKKTLAEGIDQLGLVEGIRYPLFFFLILFSCLIGFLFISQFLAKKIVFFAEIQKIKNLLYQKKWPIFLLAGINALVAILVFFFPAGVTEMVFLGDFLPCMVSLTASVFLTADQLFFKEEDRAGSNPFAQFLSNFAAVIGFAIWGVMLIHFIVPTIFFL